MGGGTHRIDDVQKSDVTATLSGGFLGVAEEVFPHPQSWKFPGITGNIATATVRQITARLTISQTEPPTCMTSWEERVRLPIDWGRVALTTTSSLLTPRDYASYMKNVVQCTPHIPSQTHR